MSAASLEYVAAGGNRHPSAADWYSNILAYGTGSNIALWQPQNNHSRGVTALLSGHTDAVNTVKVFQDPSSKKTVIVSGSSDKSIRIWFNSGSSITDFTLVKTLTEHTASVNAIAVLPDSGLFITGAADARVIVWRLGISEGLSVEAEIVQSISLKPRFFPLAIAITQLQDCTNVFAVAGTAASIQIYLQREGQFNLSATLTGHEGWLRSLDFVRESSAADSDILLASASQDKYIRLWRFHKGSELPAAAASATDPALGAFGKSLSNKAHYIGEGQSQHSITFEALLIGHEDWIYTAQWFTKASEGSNPRLLTASADNSLAVWERDVDSGVWTCATRLGEISAQKGSTSATGSTGGFWIGLWSPDGETMVSLGRTGSWRMWTYQTTEDRWIQQVGISGHIKEVKDVVWSRDGMYLLSTGSDQTTRLYSQWKRDDAQTWHEMARPQIHGFDLNCLDSVGKTQFISGADEKLLRVFNKPRAVANLLNKLGRKSDDISTDDLPEAANIPVLGLSNKAITASSTEEEVVEAISADPLSTHDRSAADPSTATHKSPLDLERPPFEDHLARHTLWPEHEKLYGHGYEISAVATSHDGALVATACRASSLDHAVIRLYETRGWREVRPALAAHTLTVTSLAFSPDDTFLLSTGRDRQWALFERRRGGSDDDDDDDDDDDSRRTTYALATANPKGHSRMILDCSWAPASSGAVFATSGRDKAVKIWRVEADGAVECKATIATSGPATAVAFTLEAQADRITLAYGTEDGGISVAVLDRNDWAVVKSLQIDSKDLPSAAINALRWRPGNGNESELAVASDDHSVRLFALHGL
ncbi:hypothetical protein MBLNU459_g4732t1 [Dothideomycetes sp. NU459]